MNNSQRKDEQVKQCRDLMKKIAIHASAKDRIQLIYDLSGLLANRLSPAERADWIDKLLKKTGDKR